MSVFGFPSNSMNPDEREFAARWPLGRKVWHGTFKREGRIVGYVTHQPTSLTGKTFTKLLVEQHVDGRRVEWDARTCTLVGATPDLGAILKAAIDKPPFQKELEQQSMNTAGRGVGAKWDGGKPMFDLLEEDCALAVLGVVQVMTWAVEVKQYKPGSWQTVPEAIKRYGAAMRRHQNAKARGERYDKESGLLHDFHIATNAVFVAELEARVDRAAGKAQEYNKTLPKA